MSVVPPYMLDALVRHPSERVRKAAERTRSPAVPHARRRAAPAERVSGRPHPIHRLVYDCHRERTLPGQLVRNEGDRSSGDSDVDRAYEMAGETLDFYASVFGRDSIDDRGMQIQSSVHYGERYQNAFWDGAHMAYGDGDGEVFRSFTACIDIAAHELTHGLTQVDVGLAYEGESGALIESIADVFGSLVKQRCLRQSVSEADWLIGAGIYCAGIRGMGLRSLTAPGTAYDDPLLGGRDPQKTHMRDYVEDGSPEAVVHINSGIPNHAFYLFAKALGGNAWETAGRVWYDALRMGLHRHCSFRAFATATTEATQRHKPRAVDAVRRAWSDVGVL